MIKRMVACVRGAERAAGVKRTRRHRRRWLSRAALLAAALLAPGLRASGLAADSDYSFTPIIDSGGLLPGAGSAVDDIGSAAYDGESIAFHATLANGDEGIYLWNPAGTSVVADASTSIPNAGGGTFAAFRDVSLDDGNVAFFGGTADLQGAYTTLGGSLRRVIDTTMTMPLSSATFTPDFFSTSSQLDVAIEGETIALSARGETLTGDDHRGVYRELAGQLERIADINTPVPGVAFADFEAFGSVDTLAGEVVFDAATSGANGTFGIYTTRQGGDDAIRTVVNESTIIPGLDNPLNAFAPNTVRLGDDEIIFAANSAGFFRNGLYQESAGEIAVVADEDTTDPRSGNPFRSVGGVFSHDEDNTAFWSVSFDGSPGIFVNRDGQVHDVISRDMDLNGKSVAGVGLFQESQSGNDFVFRVEFRDGTTGLYLASPDGGLPSLAGDYNANGLVDAADVVLWRDTFGSSADLRADGNGNGLIDAADYTVWRSNFGQDSLLAGDYNANGIVDAADSVIWRDAFGSTTDLEADGNLNGVIEAGDYNVWRDNFGARLEALSVPSPASAMLLLVALLFALPCQRR